jgi:NADPH:quinone reductase
VDYRARAAHLRPAVCAIQLITDKRLSVEIGRRYQLEEAHQAHRDIESRATTGKLLLIP